MARKATGKKNGRPKGESNRVKLTKIELVAKIAILKETGLSMMQIRTELAERHAVSMETIGRAVTRFNQFIKRNKEFYIIEINGVLKVLVCSKWELEAFRLDLAQGREPSRFIKHHHCKM